MAFSAFSPAHPHVHQLDQRFNCPVHERFEVFSKFGWAAIQRIMRSSCGGTPKADRPNDDVPSISVKRTQFNVVHLQGLVQGLDEARCVQ